MNTRNQDKPKSFAPLIPSDELAQNNRADKPRIGLAVGWNTGLCLCQPIEHLSIDFEGVTTIEAP